MKAAEKTSEMTMIDQRVGVDVLIDEMVSDETVNETIHHKNAKTKGEVERFWSRRCLDRVSSLDGRQVKAIPVLKVD